MKGRSRPAAAGEFIALESLIKVGRPETFEEEVSLDWGILPLNQGNPPVYVIGTFHEHPPLAPKPRAPNRERTVKYSEIQDFRGRNRR